jgi:hypothetical protein
MDRSSWIAVLVAGLGGTLGYGVARGFIDLPAVGVITLALLVALSTAPTDGSVTRVLGDGSEPHSQLPIGFHPS